LSRGRSALEKATRKKKSNLEKTFFLQNLFAPKKKGTENVFDWDKPTLEPLGRKSSKIYTVLKENGAPTTSGRRKIRACRRAWRILRRLTFYGGKKGKKSSRKKQKKRIVSSLLTPGAQGGLRKERPFEKQERI